MLRRVVATLPNEVFDLWARVLGPVDGNNAAMLNVESGSGALGNAAVGAGVIAANPFGSVVCKQQLVGLELPHVSIVLEGMRLSAAQQDVMNQDDVRYPKVRYFVEHEDGVPINWVVPYGDIDGNGANDAFINLNMDGGNPHANLLGAQSAGTRAEANAMLETLGFKYRIRENGSIVRGLHSVRQAGTAAVIDPLLNAFPVANGVTWNFRHMYHMGPAHAHVFGLMPAAPHAILGGDALRTAALQRGGGKQTGRYSFKVYPAETTSLSNTFVHAQHGRPLKRVIEDVTINWTAQPTLEVELVDLSPSIQIRPVQQLWLPQREIYYHTDLADNPSQNQAFPISFDNPADTVVLNMTNIRLNEVPTSISIFGELDPTFQTRFDYVEHLRPFVQSIELSVAETPQVTNQYPSELLYRMFRENTLSRMSYDQWTNNCIVVISPQQIGLPNFSEGLAVVTSVNLRVTVAMSPMAKRLYSNWDSLNYTGSTAEPIAGDQGDNQILANSVNRPSYRLRTHMNFDNRSLLMNARREMIQKKNARKVRGWSGLDLVKTGKPVTQG